MTAALIVLFTILFALAIVYAVLLYRRFRR
jgi:hypothetical protein